MDRRGDEARGNGFLARMLVVKPDGMAGKRVLKKSLNFPRSEIFNGEVYENIQKNSIFSEEQIEHEKICLKFTEDAKKIWDDFYESVESHMGKGGIYEYYKDHASKLMDNASRIAGLVSYFEKGSAEDIDSHTLEYAIEIAQVSSYYFIKYLADVPEVVTNAEVLVAYLYGMIKEVGHHEHEDEKHANNQNSDKIRDGKSLEFNWTDVLQRGPSVLRNRKKFVESIEVLCKIGHVKIQEDNDYTQKKSFRFCESIINHEYGKVGLENGKSIYVRNLPRFDQQYYGSLKNTKPTSQSGLTDIGFVTDRNILHKDFYIICDQYDN